MRWHDRFCMKLGVAPVSLGAALGLGEVGVRRSGPGARGEDECAGWKRAAGGQVLPGHFACR